MCRGLLSAWGPKQRDPEARAAIRFRALPKGFADRLAERVVRGVPGGHTNRGTIGAVRAVRTPGIMFGEHE